MSKTNKFLLLSLTIFVSFLIFNFVKKTGEKISKTTSSKPTVQTKNNPDSKVNEGGNVTVTVTPKVLKIGKKTVFEIEFETHSVDLSFDVTKISSLVDEKGRVLNQSIWEGTEPGGHHREGTLTFNTVLSNTKFAKLIIRDVSDIPKRTFRWEL